MPLNRHATPGPPSRCASNDPARHECRLRSDEARTSTSGSRLARRAGAGDPLPVQRHHRRADGQSRRAAQGPAEGQADRCVGRRAGAIRGPYPFDIRAARRYAELAVRARAAGSGFRTPDGYISAIAAAHDFAVASRGTSAFNAAGMTVIDPWTTAV